jgi:hypothetical protein
MSIEEGLAAIMIVVVVGLTLVVWAIIRVGRDDDE